MLLKILGIFLMMFGFFMLGCFPAQIYQRSAMTKTGVYVGLVSFLIGITLLVFG